MVSGAGEESLLLDSVIDWPQGDLARIAAVRAAAICQKVACHNVRDLSASVAPRLEP